MATNKADEKEIPDSWRDPSGWRPTPLQMSVPPEAVGERPETWLKRQPLYRPDELAVWLATRTTTSALAKRKKGQEQS